MNSYLRAFAASIVLSLASISANAITLTLSPASQTATAGQALPVFVDLGIADLGNGLAPSLGIFDLRVSFNPTVLRFVGATYGTGLDLGFGSVQIPATAAGGEVSLFEVALASALDLDASQSGAFVLAQLSFSAIGAGVSALDILLTTLGDAAGDPLAAQIIGASVTVERGDQQVPEPGSIVLVGAALLGLCLNAARRRGLRTGAIEAKSS
jgi:hypothetical protein